MRLCQALEISVGELFETHTGELVRAGEYPKINFGGERHQRTGAGGDEERRNRAGRARVAVGSECSRELGAAPDVPQGRGAERVEEGKSMLAGDAETALGAQRTQRFDDDVAAGAAAVVCGVAHLYLRYVLDVGRAGAHTQSTRAGRSESGLLNV